MTAPGPVPRGPATVLVVMGVSGAGKTTIGAALAERLGWTFQEGDDFHPAANLAKMKAGKPLDDADRAPWLARVEAWISAQLAAGRSGVITCSALKQTYRSAIIGGRSDVILVYLSGSRQIIQQRLEKRRGHFMPSSLLASQFAALQTPVAGEKPIVVNIDQPVAAQVDEVVASLARRLPGSSA
ncbi:gluconokinase [Phenylobacterium sp.]|uniref:gluconokinase n=1 Tax=Phenylobacterium sp. TaxID=1871053 RepID=UPI0011FB33FB|nr:gluconokinase [Phenylobacterium sp.]THD55991.1 MAG: gluconokinase [Phenylobacterium sp.]